MRQVNADSDLRFRRARGGYDHGFTLVELLVTLVVLAILLGLAVPSMVQLVATRRANGLTNELVTSINLARSEAIKRNDRVVLCKSPDASACVITGSWQQGWILFHDVNNNAQLDSAAGEVVLRRHNPDAAGITLTGNTPVANYLSMSASGMPKLISGAFQAGTFTICTSPAFDESVKQIVLSATGRPRIQNGSLSDCN